MSTYRTCYRYLDQLPRNGEWCIVWPATSLYPFIAQYDAEDGDWREETGNRERVDLADMWEELASDPRTGPFQLTR